jgi:ATP-dependent DNA helicase RecG
VTDLATPLRSAVGGRTATPLEKHLGLRSVGDLVHHYPRRYARRGELTSLADLRVGEHVTVMAEVRKVSGRNMKERKGHVLEVEVTDGTGRLYLTFFNQ